MNFDSHMSGVVAATVELVNALTPGWSRGREYLPDPANFVEQADRALHPSGDGVRPSPDQALELAFAAGRLREVFELLQAGATDTACERVNELLRNTEAVPVLSNHDGPWHLHFHALDADYARSWEAGMATSLAVVVGNADADRLGVCLAPACDRVYVDTSRNGTRRFCSTACQNRVKAAHFRQRRNSDD